MHWVPHCTCFHPDRSPSLCCQKASVETHNTHSTSWHTRTSGLQHNETSQNNSSINKNRLFKNTARTNSLITDWNFLIFLIGTLNYEFPIITRDLPVGSLTMRCVHSFILSWPVYLAPCCSQSLCTSLRSVLERPVTQTVQPSNTGHR